MRRRLVQNLGWKIFSIAAAIVLWMWLVGETEVSTSVAAPVQFENAPADLEISSDIVERLHLRVRGPATALRADSLASAAVLLDLGSVGAPGEKTFSLGPDNIRLPDGLVLTRVVPSQLRIRFERRAAKAVPVEVQFAGPPPSGYRIGATLISPTQLRITGPEGRVEQIRQVHTDPIDLRGAVGSRQFRVTAFVEDSHVRFESGSEVQVRVSLEKVTDAPPEKNTSRARLVR